jgi:hypothetical protein
MATKRTQAVASPPAAQSEFISSSCDAFAVRGLASKQQEKIAAIAFVSWMDRAFRNGSPQEDWLKSLRQVQRRRRPSVRMSATSSSART